MIQEDYSKIEDILINFAKSENDILGLSRGFNPEVPIRTYYLLTGSKNQTDMTLLTKVAGLDESLNDSTSNYFDLAIFPRDPNGARESYTGELIWSR